MKLSVGKKIGNWFASIGRALRTRRGHNVVLYLICLAVAFLFWIMMSLDEPTERDYRIPLELTNVPDSVVVVGNLPPYLSVVVKGKGTQFVRYDVMGVPMLSIDFRQYTGAGDYISLSRAKLDSKLRELFGQGVSILAVNPDSLYVGYTSGSGFKVPVKIDWDVQTSSHSVISGPIRSSIDSVMVYTVSNLRPNVEFIETEPISLRNISDTTVVNVALKHGAGLRVIPDHVDVTIPVELLVSKKSSLPIRFKNLPENTRVITYPSVIEVSYLVPVRLSNAAISAKAIVDYNLINQTSRLAPVEIESGSGGYRIVSVSQDSVEYVIER